MNCNSSGSWRRCICRASQQGQKGVHEGITTLHCQHTLHLTLHENAVRRMEFCARQSHVDQLTCIAEQLLCSWLHCYTCAKTLFLFQCAAGGEVLLCAPKRPHDFQAAGQEERPQAVTLRSLMQYFYPKHADAHAATYMCSRMSTSTRICANEAPKLYNSSFWSKSAHAVSVSHACRCSCGLTSCSRMGTPF